MTGAIDKCETDFQHHMKVTRVWEAPRVTQAHHRRAVGGDRGPRPPGRRRPAPPRRAPDAGRRADLRLGRRPRRRRVEHRRARAPTKRRLAADLMERLRLKYGAGGLPTTARASGIPGEQLPRWSLNLFWRRDREPIWTHPELFADERRDDGVTEAQARQFLHGVAAPGAGRRVFRPTRTSGTTCGASANCRSTSIPSMRGWPIRWSASACARSSARGSTHVVGHVLARWRPPRHRGRAGRPGRGSCASAAT